MNQAAFEKYGDTEYSSPSREGKNSDGETMVKSRRQSSKARQSDQQGHGNGSRSSKHHSFVRNEKHAKSYDHGYCDEKSQNKLLFVKNSRNDNWCADEFEKHQESQGRSDSRRQECDERSKDSNNSQEYSNLEHDSPHSEDDSDTDSDDASKTIPWVPPPLPEHLRVFPAAAGQTLYPPPKNQFQNDGSFMDIFYQRMEALKTLNQPTNEEKCLSMTSAASDLGYLKPVVTKRRVAKTLKTGIVQKSKRKVDAVCPKPKGKDAWSRYMKEVKKYCANKCVESVSCRPLMK